MLSQARGQAGGQQAQQARQQQQQSQHDVHQYTSDELNQLRRSSMQQQRPASTGGAALTPNYAQYDAYTPHHQPRQLLAQDYAGNRGSAHAPAYRPPPHAQQHSQHHQANGYAGTAQPPRPLQTGVPISPSDASSTASASASASQLASPFLSPPAQHQQFAAQQQGHRFHRQQVEPSPQQHFPPQQRHYLHDQQLQQPSYAPHAHTNGMSYTYSALNLTNDGIATSDARAEHQYRQSRPAAGDESSLANALQHAQAQTPSVPPSNASVSGWAQPPPPGHYALSHAQSLAHQTQMQQSYSHSYLQTRGGNGFRSMQGQGRRHSLDVEDVGLSGWNARERTQAEAASVELAADTGRPAKRARTAAVAAGPVSSTSTSIANPISNAPSLDGSVEDDDEGGESAGGTPRATPASSVTSGGGGGSKKGEKRFVCPHGNCGRAFARNYNLQSHIKSHLGVRNFACPDCGKKFSRKHDCTRHCVALHGYDKETGAKPGQQPPTPTPSEPSLQQQQQQQHYPATPVSQADSSFRSYQRDEPDIAVDVDGTH